MAVNESGAGVQSVPASEATAGLGRAVTRYQDLPPARKRQVMEAARLYDAACTGSHLAIHRFQEALTTSDFQYLFGVAMDRELLSAYEAYPTVWPQFAAATTVRDFKPKKLVDLLGGRARLSLVPEGDQYPLDSASDAEFEIAVKKYGKRFGITWEATVNDDLDALRQLPQRQAEAARLSEDYAATAALVSAGGPNSTFFASGNGNLISGNPVLSQSALASAITEITTRRDDTDDIPLLLPSLILMVPPALQLAAQDIINTTERRTTVSSTEFIVSGNGLGVNIRLVVNPWLSVIDTSANTAKTWYLLPEPNSPRPAAAFARLRGHEAPDLRVQNLAGVRPGGGAVDPMEGDFELDTINYRVRHVFGAAAVDPFATAVSTGAGS